MDEKKFSKEVCKIYDALTSRINEALEKKNWNPAYEVAFKIGLMCDIEEALKKTKLQPRKPVKIRRTSNA